MTHTDEEAIKFLIQSSIYMRDNSGYNRKLRQVCVTDSIWSPWCAQLKYTLHTLEKHNEG